MPPCLFVRLYVEMKLETAKNECRRQKGRFPVGLLFACLNNEGIRSGNMITVLLFDLHGIIHQFLSEFHIGDRC